MFPYKLLERSCEDVGAICRMSGGETAATVLISSRKYRADANPRLAYRCVQYLGRCGRPYQTAVLQQRAVKVLVHSQPPASATRHLDTRAPPLRQQATLWQGSGRTPTLHAARYFKPRFEVNSRGLNSEAQSLQELPSPSTPATRHGGPARSGEGRPEPLKNRSMSSLKSRPGLKPPSRPASQPASQLQHYAAQSQVTMEIKKKIKTAGRF